MWPRTHLHDRAKENVATWLMIRWGPDLYVTLCTCVWIPGWMLIPGVIRLITQTAFSSCVFSFHSALYMYSTTFQRENVHALLKFLHKNVIQCIIHRKNKTNLDLFDFLPLTLDEAFWMCLVVSYSARGEISPSNFSDLHNNEIMHYFARNNPVKLCVEEQIIPCSLQSTHYNLDLSCGTGLNSTLGS